MRPTKLPARARPSIPTQDESSFHRSSAVARMLRMPVATLRVWERRYGLTQAALSPSGQRLYSATDVQRLALVKQLTDLGHAIGSLAALDMRQLQAVASTHAQALAATHAATHAGTERLSPGRVLRVAVIGAALARRLQPRLLLRLGRPMLLLGPFDTIAQAAASLESAEVDALLFHQPQLHDEWSAAITEAAPGLADVPRAVFYGFATDAVCDTLAAAGTVLLREPQPDAVLAQWLGSLAPGAAPTAIMRAGSTPSEPAPPRRWDDAALADFAGLSSTVACECPRHVAELLVQLSHFEDYSAQCESRSPGDARLHAYLRQMAATSRARFEDALEHVATHEGLLLPSPSGRTG